MKPKKMKVPHNICNCRGCDVLRAYNQACDEWEAYHKEEIARYIKTFRHYHEAGKFPHNIDTCGKCGLDIRDKIHIGELK